MILKKVVFLARERFDLIEVRILLLGLLLAVLTGLYFLYLLFADPSLYKVLTSTAIVHAMGGRALGIANCLAADISLFYTIVYNFYLEVVIVLIAYGAVVLVMRNIIQPKLFRSAVRHLSHSSRLLASKASRGFTPFCHSRRNAIGVIDEALIGFPFVDQWCVLYVLNAGRCLERDNHLVGCGSNHL